jgi:hypothetical protein
VQTVAGKKFSLWGFRKHEGHPIFFGEKVFLTVSQPKPDSAAFGSGGVISSLIAKNNFELALYFLPIHEVFRTVLCWRHASGED